MGYVVKDRKLTVDETEAALVRSIFQRFLKLGSATRLVRQLALENVRNRYGKPQAWIGTRRPVLRSDQKRANTSG